MKHEALSILGLLGCAQAAQTLFSIGSCADLQEAVDATSAGRVVGELTTSEISCASWTNFEIKDNRLKLVAATDDDVFVFHNVRFVVAAGATLRVLPSVEFTGTEGETQEVDGGVLNVAESGRVRFKSDVHMHDVKVLSVAPEGSDFSPDRWNGGCVFNKGILRMDAKFKASNCMARGGGRDSADGDGNGIWNGESGQVVIKGEVDMADCGNREVEGNLGGAVYNLGKFSIFSNASFTANRSSAGAIYNGSTGVFKCLKNSVATFTENKSSDASGGAVTNTSGGYMTFNGGADFKENFTEGSGGAVGNSGYLRIKKSASFIDNRSASSGGAINNSFGAELILPSDTVFEGNTIPDGDYSWINCEDIYMQTEDGFECLP